MGAPRRIPAWNLPMRPLMSHVSFYRKWRPKTFAEISGRYSVDVIEIDAASNRGIEEIRELRDRIRLAPTEGRYKVYIIDEAHMLTKETANALLKTLEEPPAHAILVLVTTEPHRLPATILSRCQRFDFRRVSQKEIVARLKLIAAGEGL